MTKTEIIKRLQQTTGKTFLNISDVAKVMGQGRDNIRNMLKGVDYYQEKENGRKLYFVNDIAERIMQNRYVD